MNAKPLIQKYPAAYHYLMHNGIRTQHSSEEEVRALCKQINRPKQESKINISDS